MTRYMSITGIDCTIPSLPIDTAAPVDVLQDTAAYRIRCVTQLLEESCLRATCWMWSDGGYGPSLNSANKNGRLQGRPFLYPTFNIIPQFYTQSIWQEAAKTSPANFLI